MSGFSKLRRMFSRAAGRKKNSKTDDNALPRWDLASLYPALDAAELESDKARLAQMTKDFCAQYKGRVSQLGGADLGAAVQAYEEIMTLSGNMSSYALLMESIDIKNFSKTGDLKKFLAQTEEETVFFAGEIRRLNARDLMTRLSAPALAYYAPWIAQIRHESRVALTDQVSALSQDFVQANTEAWQRLYQETIAGMTVMFDEKKRPLADVESRAGDENRPAKERQRARAAIAEALHQNGSRFALIYNTIARDMAIDARVCGYESVDAQANAQNFMPQEAADAMFGTMKNSYARLSHRFFRWKAQQYGLPVLPRTLLAAGLPEIETQASPSYSFGAARRLVLRAFRRFSPRFARTAAKFFDTGHIDAAPRTGKDTSAFTLSTVPGRLPFILMNFGGGTDDVVSSLGHELGHGVHQALVEKKRGFLLSGVPIPLCETASIFAEMLVMDEMLRQEKDPEQRKVLAFEKVERLLGTGLQQLSYYDFERRVYAARDKGVLSFEEISDIWLETQKEYWGPAVEYDDYDRYYWTCIPHLFTMPFYVSSYAFAQGAVTGLYQAYQDAGDAGETARADFVARYMEMLEAGTTKTVDEMFRDFGFDVCSKAFWEKGLCVIEEALDTLVAGDAPKTPAHSRKDTPTHSRKKNTLDF